MRIYDIKDIMAQIDALVMRQEKFIVRLYMKKYREGDDLRIYNGIYILTGDGAQDYLISERTSWRFICSSSRYIHSTPNGLRRKHVCHYRRRNC